jgi:integrase
VRRAKGEGSLLKVKGCRFWYAQYVHNGKQVRVSTREESKMKALAVLRRLMGDRDRGLAPLPDAQKLRYADLRRGLLANYTERGNRSLTTNAEGEESINGLKQLDEFFGFGPDKPGPPLTQISTETSREFARKRQAEGAGTAMVNRSLACLRRMLRIAHEDGRIQNVPKIRFLKEPPARKGFLELEKFDELVKLLPTHLQPLVNLLYYCGVRVGEALQIEWAQVDLDARLIRLEDDETKNAEARTVPLPSVLVMLLDEIKPKTGKVFSDTNLRTEWQKACAACGLGTRTLIEPEDEGAFKWYKYTGLLIHDLRRSAVRNLVNAGVPERVAMKISGHKTRAVFDRYHIVSTDDVTNAMRRLELAGVSTSERLVKKPAKSVRRLPVSRTK